MEVPLERLNVTAAASLVGRQRAARQASRDPRAAPVSIRQNVSIVETCRFYGAADALTSCRVPRSCQDCLAMPNCLLAFDGRCHDVSETMAQGAHAVMVPSSVSSTNPIQDDDPKNYFAGVNTSYCAGSDPICNGCRAAFQNSAQSTLGRSELAGQYCMGVDGCICVGMCEVPWLLTTTVSDNDCSDPVPVLSFVAPRGRHVVSSATSLHRDPRAPLEHLTHRRSTKDICEFYSAQDVQGCRVRRSCRDCLETEGCMIAGHKCMSMADYDPILDFRNTTRPASAYVQQYKWNGSANVPSELRLCYPDLQFPSSNTTYCPSSDAACVNCRTGDGQWCRSTNSTVCVGADGCVCVEQCEDTGLLSRSEQDGVCRVQGGQASSGVGVIGTLASAFVGVFFLLAMGLWALVQSRRVATYPRQAATTIMRYMLDRAPAFNLDLFGWRRFQHRLLEKEQELLDGAENVSPVMQPPVDFDFVEATAPDFEEDDSSAPTISDPHALASAPVYRVERRGEDHEDPSIPSAPDLS